MPIALPTAPFLIINNFMYLTSVADPKIRISVAKIIISEEIF